MKRNLLALTLCLLGVSAFGQGEMDAYQYSRTELSGSARGVAMGGAFGALGGDITGVAANPAGIGVYHSSEVVASMNFSSVNAQADWQGLTQKENKFKFNFDNLAYMGYFPLGNNAVQSVNFGFAYNRLKNFDRNYSSSGKGMGSSLTDYMAAITTRADVPEADIISEDNGSYDSWPYNQGQCPWLGILGYNSGMINYKSGSDNFYESLLLEGDKVNPNLYVSERGGIESYDFTAGINISDKLYLGTTFALTDIHYSMSSNYSEDVITSASDYFDLNNELSTDGAGYQVSVGAIFSPIDALRLGVAYHSPTWYSMTDYYDANGRSSIDRDVMSSHTPYDAYTDYQFQTPYRWTFSAAGIIGTKAVVSVDYELTDYRSMTLKDNNGSTIFYREDNGLIDSDYKMASTLKAGIEYRITPQISARLGYSWMENPYEKTFKEGNVEVGVVGTVPHYILNGDTHYMTGGLGFRITKNFYADVAFAYRTQNSKLYYFPNLNDEELGLSVASVPAELKNKTYKGVLTLGYKF